MDYPYWQKQDSHTPLFPDIEWSKPEQRSMAGKLAIIGGNSGGFVAVASAYQLALSTGIGQARVIVPGVLKRTIPPHISDVMFVESTMSGGIAKDDPQLLTSIEWADMILLVGDNGRSSETAIAFEQLLRGDTPLVITRDAVDLLMNASQQVVDREKTLLVLSLAQLQKLFKSLYYPKIISFSMQLLALVEVLHKFTLTYPVTIATFHHNQLIVAHNGSVTTTSYDQPMSIWRGDTATRAACFWTWSIKKPLEAVTASARSA